MLENGCTRHLSGSRSCVSCTLSAGVPINRRMRIDVTPDLIARIAAGTDVRGDSECWLWTKATRSGYGTLKYRGRLMILSPIDQDDSSQHPPVSPRKGCAAGGMFLSIQFTKYRGSRSRMSGEKDASPRSDQRASQRIARCRWTSLDSGRITISQKAGETGRMCGGNVTACPTHVPLRVSRVMRRAARTSEEMNVCCED